MLVVGFVESIIKRRYGLPRVVLMWMGAVKCSTTCTRGHERYGGTTITPTTLQAVFGHRFDVL